MQSEVKVSSTKTKPIHRYPSPHEHAAFNQLYIKTGRPLPVYLKHAYKVLIKHDVIIIHAMTAAIYRACQISVKVRKQFPYLVETVYTDSVPTLVEMENGGKELREKSAIHIVLKKNYRQKSMELQKIVEHKKE